VIIRKVARFPIGTARHRTAAADAPIQCLTRFMQRSPIACRRAVHSLNPPPSSYVWITDDLLDLTVNRFFRSGCRHQKRHGSQVPGPLEARRRAVKRRMTLQAHLPSAGPSLPLFSFGALFAGRLSPKQLWRYEPPSAPISPDALNIRKWLRI
jgi:hypothetical protein